MSSREICDFPLPLIAIPLSLPSSLLIVVAGGGLALSDGDIAPLQQGGEAAGLARQGELPLGQILLSAGGWASLVDATSLFPCLCPIVCVFFW